MLENNINELSGFEYPDTPNVEEFDNDFMAIRSGKVISFSGDTIFKGIFYKHIVN